MTTTIDEAIERKKKIEDIWVPACGMSETSFISRSGRKLMYCWNKWQNKHAYLDCETDIILTDKEAEQYMMMV